MHEKLIPNVEYLAWKHSNRLLKGWITSSLSKEVVNHIVGLESARDVWKTLKNACSLSTEEREFALYYRMQLLKRDQCESLQDYIKKFKNICDELQSIDCLLQNHRKVFWVLRGLGDDYMMFTTMAIKPPTPTYAELLKLLQSFELRVIQPSMLAKKTNQVEFVGNKGKAITPSNNSGRNMTFS